MALSLNDFSTMAFVEEDWIIPHILTRQNTAFMIGPPKKSSKSWLLLEASIALSEGRAPWDMQILAPPKPMRTVYFTQEDTDRNIHGRVRNHLDAGLRPNDRFWVVPKNLNIRMNTPEGRLIIRQELNLVKEKSGPIDLIIFDTMRKIHSGNENDSETILGIWHEVDKLHKEFECATIFAHHTKKPPTDPTGWDPTDPFIGRGSGDIYGGGDAFMVVVPGEMAKDKSTRTVSMHFESKRDEELAAATLRVTFRTGRVDYLGVAGEQPKMLKISNMV